MNPLIRRRILLQSAAASALAATLPSRGQARPPSIVKLIAGFPAGGSIDAVCRRLADQLKGAVADTVIVENRPGAGGRIAIEALRNGPADGSQWLVTPGSMLVIYPHVYKKLSYDPVKDLLPVAQVAHVPLALAVGPAVPGSVQDVSGLIAWLKANPAQANIGTPAAGNITHFLAYLLERSSGVKLQYVPFRGSAPAILDLLGGQVPAVINPVTEMLPHLPAGKLRVLAVTSRQRSGFVPQVPTMIEQGHPSVLGSEWMGLFGHRATPAPLVERMAAAVRKALEASEFREALAKLALEPGMEGGPKLAQRIGSELASWREVSKAFGFQLED